MALLKRLPKRKRPTRPRPRKMAKTAKISRMIRTNEVSLTRVANVGTFTINKTGGFQGSLFKYRLIDIPNYAEFTALFDEYRICAIKITLIPRWTTNELEQATANVGTAAVWRSDPIIWFGIDRDGDQVVSSELAVMQATSARLVKNYSKPINVYCRAPMVKNAIVSSGTIQGGQNTTGWINTSNPNVEHSGIYFAGYIPDGTINSAVQYSMYAKYYLKLRKAI